MNAMIIDRYGTAIEPATLQIQRLLPGPVERVWDYLTKSDLRRRWLASGDMVLEAGAPFALTWRNDELTDPPGQRPEGFGAEHTMGAQILAADPPRRLVFNWNDTGEVEFVLEPQGGEVLLTLTHRRVPSHNLMLGVSAGWHTHLDVLAARLEGTAPAPFWDSWQALRAEYAERMPA